MITFGRLYRYKKITPSVCTSIRTTDLRAHVTQRKALPGAFVGVCNQCTKMTRLIIVVRLDLSLGVQVKVFCEV